jgi:hypothetical protein
MSDELESRLSAYADQLDASAPPISTEEIRARELDDRGAHPHGTRRRVLAAASVMLIVASGASATAWMLRGETDTLQTPVGSSQSVAPATDPSVSPTTIEPGPSIGTDNAPAPTTTPTSAPPDTSEPPAPELTIDDVRAAQIAALRQLNGFTATATQSGLVGDDISVEFTMLPDRSIWVDTGDGTWGSHDSSTGFTRGAFVGPDGQMAYQEIVGQSGDSSLPLSILVGYDPTQIVQPLYSDAEQTGTVTETEHEGRPAWEVIVTSEFPEFAFDEEGNSTVQIGTTTQVERKIIDQETGLVVVSEMSSSDPSWGSESQMSSITDISATDVLPSEFPGTFPDGATVDRSGDPNGFSPATADVDDVVATLGIPVPIPPDASAGSISIAVYPEFTDQDGGTSTPYAESITATFTTYEGFVAHRVTISARRLLDGGVDEFSAVVDGLLCADFDRDALCDSPEYGPPTDGQPDSIVVSSGALADATAVPDIPGTISLGVGPLGIIIDASDQATAESIANAFVLVQPT